MPGELTFMERVRRRASSELPSFIEQVREQAAQQEQAGYAQQQAELAYARGVLESSPIPGLRALTTEVGADIVSLGARIIGKSEYADRMNRFANSIEQAAGERDVDSFLPAILSRGARGAGRSMGTMIPAGAVAGPYGAIAAASALETNRAITEGRDAGLKGRDLAEYAATQGVIEAAPAAAMQVMGLGGVESIFGKKTISVGIKEGLKRLGITLAQELPEEIVIEISHNIAAKFADVDPNAMDRDVIIQTIADTVVQTGLMVGFSGAPGIARSVKAGKVKKITDEMTTIAKEGRVPSRKKWREWKMAPEVGTSRSQRRAFSQELAKQLEEPSQEEVVPEAPERAPVAAQKVPVEQKQLWELSGDEFSKEYAKPALKMKDGKVLTSPRGHLDIIEHQDKYSIDDVAESGWAYRSRDNYVSEDEMKAETSGKALGWPEAHRALIKRAISEGKPVPPEILAEYPDLGAPEAALTPAEAEGVLAPGVVQEGLTEPQGATDLALEPQSEAGLGLGPQDEAKLALEPQMEADLGLEPPEARGEIIDATVVPETREEAVDAPIIPGTREEAVDAPIIEGQAPPEVAIDQETVALNNVAEEEIRQAVGLDAVPKEKLEPAKALLADVIATKDAEKAITVARSVKAKPRGVSRREHVSMVVKTRELLNELDDAWSLQAKAAETGNAEAFSDALVKEKEISKQLDDLVTASQYSGTEVSGMFSIRQMRLSRDPSDYTSILKRVQAAMGPKGIASDRQKKEISRLSKENAELTEENERLVKADQAERDKQIEADAQKVFNANKPKKGTGKEYGRKLKEKASVEIEDIKEQIRQLGFRVNDITGVSAEGAWLIGRLGVAYTKKGVGTLVEVAEQVMADMSDAKLSKIDVYEALNARNPKIIAKERSETEKKVAKFKTLARMHVEIDKMSRGIDPEITQKAPVDEDIKALQKVLSKVRHNYFYADIVAEKLERATEKLDLLQDQLKTGRSKVKKEPAMIPPELIGINKRIREVTSEIRVKEALAKTEEQLRTGILDKPEKRVKKVISPETERNQIRLHANKRAIQQLIRNAAPLTILEKIAIVPNEARTLMATGELSYTFRQNVVNVMGHPIRTLGLKGKVMRVEKALRGEAITTPEEAFFPSLKAAFSQDSADVINNNLRNSPNGPIYELTDLAIHDNESPDDRLRSDVFRGRYVEKVPVLGSIVRASARHGVSFSNMARTANMDHFIHMYPNATREELNAWANVQNTFSGLGSLWKAARAAKELGYGFFSPRFSVSRVQTPFKIAQYWHLPRVRKEIAKDLARFVSSGVSVLAMASFAIPGSVEWWDFDDPDWGKIRIGNTRWDIWGSFLQPARVVARILAGATARLGLIAEREPVDFVDLFTRFAMFKVSPLISIPRELLSGKTAVGKETSVAGTLARHSIMLFLQDTYDAAKSGGPLMGGSVFLSTGLGGGAQTYQDSRTAAFKKIRKYYGRGEYGLAAKYKDNWNKHNMALPPSKRKKPIGTVKRLPKK